MDMITAFEQRLARGEIILLDGATGTELERRGVPMDRAAWSAAALATHPEVVRAIHEDYIRAGSEVIVTNSFSTARHQLEPAGLGDRFRELNERAVTIALEARQEAAEAPVLVAGSLSPVHFERDYMCPVETAAANFRDQAEILAEAGVDLLMLEMIWDVAYSPAAVEAAVTTGLPVWAGFSCRHGDDGTVMLFSEKFEGSLESALDVVLPLLPGRSLISVMHTEVEVAAAALRTVREHAAGPFGVYAHSGRFVMPNWEFNDVIAPADYLAEARKWVAMGAQAIGGCCGIGPEHIRRLREGLPSRMPGTAPGNAS